jgi:hypothetical protein
VEAVIAHDNESDARERVPIFLGTPEALEALNITRSATEIPLVMEKDGKQFKVTLPRDEAPITRRIDWKLPDGWIDARTATPLWLKNTDKSFWSEYLPDSRTMYVQYNAVYPQGDVLPGAFFREALKEAETKGAEKFVVDARLNNGGNNGFNRQIIHAFIRSDRFNQRGKLFTIIGRRTFSAAQNFVNHMELNTQTLFVGEPTGGRPNHYGDNVPLVLPNSKLEIRLSTLWWQDVDPRDTRQWRAPDIATAMTFAEYRDGKDPALQAILEYGAKPSVAELVRTAIEKDDVASAKTALADFKADPANQYVTAEVPINRLGYELLAARKVENAIAVFKLNAEAFPDSGNVWDSLGEGYMAANRNAEAIAAYEKAYALNPKNGNARAMLQRLRARQ